ncbi:hypothetical protein ABKN59_003169 [Abortiporus biennis]
MGSAFMPAPFHLPFMICSMLGLTTQYLKLGMKKGGDAQKADEHQVSFTLTTPSAPRTPRHDLGPAPKPPVHIPDEIIINVLEAACDSEDIAATRSLLRSTSLVSKDWSILSQKLLFRDVVLKDEPSYTAFQRATERSSARGCMLGDSVHHLRVTMDPNQPCHLSQHDFAHAVTLCPNLRSLSVSLYGQGDPGSDVVGLPDVGRLRRTAPAFDNITLSMLRSGPSIRSLQFTNWSDNSTTLSQLLDTYPSLKSLSINGTPPLPPSPTPGPCSFALEEFRINCQSAPSAESLAWLLHGSKSSLRRLIFDRRPTLEVFNFLVSEYCSVLEFLAIPALKSISALKSLERCSALRELRLEEVENTSAICSSLGQIEHLAVGVRDAITMRQVVSLVKKCVLADVKIALIKRARVTRTFDLDSSIRFLDSKNNKNRLGRLTHSIHIP